MSPRRTETQKDYQERILRVLVHVQNHLDDPLDLEQLAALAIFSPFHFHRVFRGMVGEPIQAHVRRLRLERAAAELKGGSPDILQVALNAGYDSHEAFTRAFRTRFGAAPSDYRRAHAKASPSGVYYDPDGVAAAFRPLTKEPKTMDAKIETLDAMRVAFVRHVGPYKQVGSAWGQLCAWAGPKGLLGPQTTMLAISHDDPDVTPPDKLRYDACLTVGEDVTAEGNVGVQDIPGGRFATMIHCGPYAKLGESYATLFGQWMPAEDLQPVPGEPALEFYLNSPEGTSEADLRTRICVRIRPQ